MRCYGYRQASHKNLHAWIEERPWLVCFLYVRFRSGCISPHILLYHVNHMIVLVMSIAVEIVLLAPNLWIHVHSYDIRADLM